MIPLVLANGKMSFIGIQVKFDKEDGVKKAIDDVTEKMTFPKMFKGENDRPFGLIILALGYYQDNILEVFLERTKEHTLMAPAILVFKGIPKSFQNISKWFIEEVPKNYSYRGICYDHLKSCDHLFELVHELPLTTEEKAVLGEYTPPTWYEATENETNKSKPLLRTQKTSSITSGVHLRKKNRSKRSKVSPSEGDKDAMNDGVAGS